MQKNDTDLKVGLARIEEHMKSVDASSKLLSENYSMMQKQLFVGNGTPPILPNLAQRLTALEVENKRKFRRDAAVWLAILTIGASALGGWMSQRTFILRIGENPLVFSQGDESVSG